MHSINLSPKLCFNTFRLTSVCCVFRTGQCVCGRWTVPVVRCTVWPRAPATPMLWAPSAAPGKTPTVTQVFLITCTNRDKELCGKCFKRGGDLENDPPSLCMFVSRLKASFVVSGSQDCTVKVWDLPADLSTSKADVHQLTPRATEKAHDKVQAHFRKEGKKTCNYL